MVRHLYVHIPFCPKVCPYCSFYKEASDANKTPAFVDAVLSSAEAASQGLQPWTVFFGGGTPTALPTPLLARIVRGLQERIDFSEVQEFTMEMNPATVSLEKAELMRALGVNRVSMGVQSWDPVLLQTLGRVHTAEQAERSFQILRQAGFENVNLDLIFGIPGQTEKQWRDSLARTVGLGPEHIAAYSLTYEEDTEYFRRFQAGEIGPDEARDGTFFEVAMDVLPESGYGQYEISNYAKAGSECRHNLGYWTGADYEGLGPSAFSTRSGRRRRVVADTSEFIHRVSAGLPVHDFEERVDENMRTMETVAFSLRTRDGVPADTVPADRVRQLLEAGLVERTGTRLRLTRRGRLLADTVAGELV